MLHIPVYIEVSLSSLITSYLYVRIRLTGSWLDSDVVVTCSFGLFRPRSRGRSHVFDAEIVLDDDYSRSVEARSRRTENLTGGSAANGFPPADSSSETERLGLSREPNKKPDGLTQEALDCLHLELFSSTELAVKELVSRTSLECSICLESFVLGDELIRLPCGHRFHAVCLDPWVRIRGDCPYCRSVIVVTSQRAESSI